jgi:hypothetical protein
MPDTTPARTREAVDPDRSPIFVVGTGRSGTTLGGLCTEEETDDICDHF